MWPNVDEACDSVVRIAKRVKPIASDVTVMNQAYAAYRRLYPALRSVFMHADGTIA
jgi:sugar (pentulose or hexulose) kinase